MSNVGYLSMSDGDKKTLLEKLRARVGQPSGPPGPAPRDPINRPMIHHLCDALGDTNPVYLDEDFAKKSVFGGIIAPPTSLQVWGMGRPRYGTAPMASQQRVPRTDGEPDPQAQLANMGFDGVVATNCEQIYERPLRPGDYLRGTGSLDSVSDEKHTGLGIGYFTTTKSTFTNQDGEVIGHHLFRILRYIPGTGRTAPGGSGGAAGNGQAEAQPRSFSPKSDEETEAIRRGELTQAPIPNAKTLSFDQVQVGDELPKLLLPMFPMRIIASALSTRDFQDVHHDRDSAQQKQNKDIFPNILTTNGWVGRFITDWAGPNAVLKSCAIRLGAPSYQYDILTITGQVKGKEDGVLEVAVRGACSLGDHVTGTVRVELG
jgi:acyl dehydratase